MTENLRLNVNILRRFHCNDLSWFTFTNIQNMHHSLINSKVSKNIHDQGESLFCWAFAISSMLRQSLKLFIISSDLGLIRKNTALEKLIGDDFHRQLRNELIMLPIPKIKYPDIRMSLDQSHYIDMAIQRVINYMIIYFLGTINILTILTKH